MITVNSQGTGKTGVNPVQFVVEVSNKGKISFYDCNTKDKKELKDVNKIGKLNFAFIAQSFFFEGYVPSEEAKYESTPYQKGSESVKIFKGCKDTNGKWVTTKEWEGVKDSQDFKMRTALWKMSCNMNIYCTDQKGRLIRLVLSPSGRNAFFDWRSGLPKASKPNFKIVGFEMKDHGSPEIKPSLIPTFEYCEPNKEQAVKSLENEKALIAYYAPEPVAPVSQEAAPEPPAAQSNDDLPF